MNRINENKAKKCLINLNNKSTEKIEVHRYYSLEEISKEDWEKNLNLPLHLKYDFLNIVEKPAVNDLKHLYLCFSDQGKPIGRANIYYVNTDISTLDTSLPKNIRDTIKTWFPNFLNFRVLECGHFTLIGDGFYLSDEKKLDIVLPLLIKEMDLYSLEKDIDFHVIRDISVDKFSMYLNILKPSGYYPALGFPNVIMPILWNDIDEYFESLKSATRYKLMKSLRLLKEKFGIDYIFTRDYVKYTKDLARLWGNVYENAKEYIREFLDEKYFAFVEDNIRDNNELLIFLHQGKPVAFMLNIFDDHMYAAYHWGVDYHFHRYKEANLFRVTNLLCLKRAIEKGVNILELGVTNYYPKLLMGAKAEPLIYFVKHRKNQKYSKVLADLLSKNIIQPDSFKHRAFKELDINPIDLDSYNLEIRKYLCDYPDQDLFTKIDKFYKANTIRLTGLYNLYPEFKSAQKSSVIMDDQKRVILLGTNSYLGAASHPEVIQKAEEALKKYGTGCSGSPLLNGTLDIHNQLEKELAAFLNKEAVVLCSTGYQTNLAGISALCSSEDLIIMDERSHRSLFDGAKLSGATFYVYRHNDMNHLEKILSHFVDKKKLIVTDSVFSMEGTIPDLKTMCNLAKKYHARTFVDEAHGVGVFGKHGRGVCEMQGVEAQVDLVMATFSKSFASIGGYIAGNYEVIDYIKHNASPHMFSASLPAVAIATVRAVLNLIQEKPEIRLKILENAKYMSKKLCNMDYNAPFRGTQIVPVIFGNQILALSAYKKFMQEGVFVNPIGPPAVSEKESGFRTSYIATHERSDLDYALEVFNKLKKDFK